MSSPQNWLEDFCFKCFIANCIKPITKVVINSIIAWLRDWIIAEITTVSKCWAAFKVWTLNFCSFFYNILVQHSLVPIIDIIECRYIFCHVRYFSHYLTTVLAYLHFYFEKKRQPWQQRHRAEHTEAGGGYYRLMVWCNTCKQHFTTQTWRT